MKNAPTISVVIVNYNVKEYLEQALQSLQRALKRISHEILVVDNASVDDSVAHIRARFPEVQLIESKVNLGFGKANNVALRRVQGEYVVLINPDTVVQEDTFEKLLDFFHDHPDAGAATCKILNPDGSFAVDCRHSIPTPSIALWKVLGLNRIFPKSKRFAQYNLTYLDTEKTYPVPAISGSFMMVKKTVLDQIGHFDERFFMYCEDIDLCHRINLGGHKIYYVPTSQIIHYKGESTKKNNVDYVITFNKALYQFFDKYYADKTWSLFRWIIVLGIVARGVFIYIRNFLHEHFPLVLDTLILNSAILLSFMVRLEFKDGFTWYGFFHRDGIINLISMVIFWIIAYYLEVYPHHRFSIQGIIKANLLTFTLLASLTFFLKQFAFSRMVVLMAAIVSPLLMSLWRMVLKRYYRGDKSAWGKDLYSKPTIIVGAGKGGLALYQKIREMKDMSYELLGVVTINDEEADFAEAHIPVLGRLENLDKLVAIHNVRQVIFSSAMLSYQQILKTMSGMGMTGLEYKIAPSNLEVMIGKSSIERLNDYPLLDIEYAIGKPFNRFTKRMLDILLALGGFVLLAPVLGPLTLWRRRRRRRIDILGRMQSVITIAQMDALNPRRPVNLWLLLGEVLRGKLSLVGFPILPKDDAGHHPHNDYWYRPGITGLVQINRSKILTPDDLEKYHIFYLKNQSLMLDLEIILKSVTKLDIS